MRDSKILAVAVGHLLEKLTTEGLDAMKRAMSASATAKAAGTLLTLSGAALAQIIGIDHCIDLALGQY